MENSFFSGSENLYKYLVTVGILLIVMTVYYPLKEKQELEVLSIKIKNELSILNYKIESNKKEADKINSNLQTATDTDLLIVKKNHLENEINQISCENKYNELISRNSYTKIYSIIFWIFFPVGIFLILFGFIKWNRTKKLDDEILTLEKKKLEIEIQKLINNP
ncbi:hypothetical protein [Flavobacterium eburneipallidum]|uniref:hypothetical protein n=1 Tax=Flavobacterium eburneipallidum TaxID=3003263 RepID=UPI0022AC64B6|nr:hypothetical protein [Flavobacterium eburneipallidum]